MAPRRIRQNPQNQPFHDFAVYFTPLNSKTKPSEKRFKKRLLSSGLWAIIGRFASIGSLIFTFRMLCGVLSPTEISVFVVASSVASIGTLVCHSGLSIVILRRTSLKNAVQKASGHASSLFMRATIFSFLIWLAFSSALFIVNEQRPDFFGASLGGVLGLTVLWSLARGMLLFFAEAARGLGRFGYTAAVGGLQQGPLVNVAVLVLLFLGKEHVETAATALAIYLVVTIAVNIAAAWVLLPQLRRGIGSDVVDVSGPGNLIDGEPLAGEPLAGEPDTGQRRQELDTSGELIREALKVTVSQLAIYGLIEFETILIARSCGEIEVGAWAAIRRVMAVVSAPLLLVNAAIPGFVSELYATKDFRRLKKLLQVTALFATPMAIFAALGLLIFGTNILGFFDSKFADFYLPLSILGIANVVFVGAGSGGMTLRMINRQGWSSATTVIIGMIYIIVAPPLIATGGIIVAALLSGAMIVVRNVIATLFVRHFLGFWCTPSVDRESWQWIREFLKKGRMIVLRG